MVATILTGATALGACQATGPSAPPVSAAPVSASPGSTGSTASALPSASASASVEAPLAAAIFGAWRPEPVAVPPILVPRVDQACRALLGADAPAGVILTIIDARGEGELQAYYASPSGAWASCTSMVVDRLGGVSGERFHIVSGGGQDDLEPLELEFTDFNWSGEKPIRASFLVGRAGAGVARVEIQSPGRPSTVASLANGWWAAWTQGPLPLPWQIVALDSLGRAVDAIEGMSQDSAG